MKNSLEACPQCEHLILNRMGTICPKCGYTKGYFNGEKRRKAYAKLFALNVFAPFISIFTIIFAQISIYSFIIGVILSIYISYKSFPLRFSNVFSNNFEKFFFLSLWSFVNIFLIVLIINIISKF
ncbi:hypothetical protein AAX26_01996 [Aliarcobacter thereius]|uniref:Uncharacterized protein n=2 Tax=Aliarcobacter thereius TaxID=544718 RepID=A0A1C0B596_9BACT|nr:hypothetical protein [Aliarcobacter thereius]OCL85360.1 hypothetical protein AAX26_01996 [Aliarcobacter thereius]OCL89636.1 hypothetical protein AAX25_01976 [Aliarcobacter thereius]OCL95592.1 hypothetical protein AA347_01065 [Aliarcobacter thereius LMG 24486]OCL97697.1 hypothetical protein AAX29_01851 [Aliarcobacter thereius]QBF16423.1 putative membrane protein [Aliarcobacter thereius LMG 24486]